MTDTDRVDRLERRLDWIDEIGTRGVSVLAVQVQELARNLAAHEVRHETERRGQVSARRWLIGTVVAVIASVDGPLITVLLQHGRL